MSKHFCSTVCDYDNNQLHYSVFYPNSFTKVIHYKFGNYIDRGNFYESKSHVFKTQLRPVARNATLWPSAGNRTRDPLNVAERPFH